MTELEVAEYAAESFFAWEDMREQRDQALIRAETAEDELVISIGHVKQLTAVLQHVRDLAVCSGQPYIAGVVSIALDPS